jgi:methionyl-tRNA formyltransferase
MPSTVFFCGHRSRYGLAHLLPISRHFDLRAVFIADDERWAIFRNALSGGAAFDYSHRRGSVRFPDIIRSARHRIRKMAAASPQSPLARIQVPIHTVHDANKRSVIDVLASYQPDVLTSAAYPQIFTSTLLNSCPRGAVNFHPSLLPRCRGAHPHYWALATGEPQGGVTAHFMTERIDDGDIVAQLQIDLDGLYYRQLYDAIVDATPTLVQATAQFLDDPSSTPTPQDHSRATYYRNDREIHRRLDFGLCNARALYNRIRAGAAYAIFQGQKIHVLQASVTKKNRHMTNDISVGTGVIVDIDEAGVWVHCLDANFLVISGVRQLGAQITHKQWVARNSVEIGQRFI